MFKLRVRCFSKNTGEVFYDYETKVFSNVDNVLQKLRVAQSVFLKRLMSDLKEDCTLEYTVLPCRDELPIVFSDEVEDYN